MVLMLANVDDKHDHFQFHWRSLNGNVTQGRKVNKNYLFQFLKKFLMNF